MRATIRAGFCTTIESERNTVKTEVNELSDVMVEVDIQVPWDEVQKELNMGYRRLSKVAKVRGFRPGRVPAHVLKRLYGDQVEDEVTEILVRRALETAVSEHQISIIDTPQVDEARLDKGEGLTVKARIEVFPEMSEVNLDGLVAYHTASEPEEKALDKALEDLRKRSADLRVVEGRAAKEGDVVVIDFTVEKDGEVDESLGGNGSQLEIEEGLLPELRAGLAGMKPGDEKSIEVAFGEENAPRVDLTGATVTFNVTLNEVKERELPELDSDFAEELGFDTIDELKAHIDTTIQDEHDRENKATLQVALIDGLIEKNEVPVPPAMLKQQQREMLQEAFRYAEMFGQQVDPRIFEGLSERAERRVKAGIIVNALSKNHGLAVTDEEIEAEFGRLAEESGKHIAKVRVEYAGERRGQLENHLLEEKVLAFLKERTEIKPADEKPEPEKATEEE